MRVGGRTAVRPPTHSRHLYVAAISISEEGERLRADAYCYVYLRLLQRYNKQDSRVPQP